MKGKIQLILTIVFLAPVSLPAQVAGNSPYTLEQSVIASGGGVSGNAAEGGAFSITGTIGQSIAGTASTNSPFILRSGFFTPELLAPTAASVTIKGRVRMANGKGIRNVQITLSAADGSTRTILSDFSGKYSFANVAVGQLVVITAAARRFSFSQPTQVLNLTEEAHDIDFIGIEQLSPIK